MAVMEPTAAGRLATAQEGLSRLRTDKAAAQGRRQAAQAVLDELTDKLTKLQRAKDIAGEDVDAALLSVTEQRAEAARQVSISSAEVMELGERIADVRAALSRLEAEVMQDELADAVAAGAGAAERYRAALEGFLAAAVVLQSDLARCARLEGEIARKGGGSPRRKLCVHLVAAGAIDQVLRVARDTSGEPAAVRRATAALFEHWQL